PPARAARQRTGDHGWRSCQSAAAEQEDVEEVRSRGERSTPASKRAIRSLRPPCGPLINAKRQSVRREPEGAATNIREHCPARRNDKIDMRCDAHAQVEATFQG